ncbi:MAG: Gldg family protein [Lachnospiraceae bacterium]|nr:Gldg family protein [Lachnospiraceae bacterium]
MTAIIKRDFISSFHNVTGWLFLGVNLLFFGIYMTLYNLSAGYSSIAYPLYSLTIVYAMMTPVLTMRSMAEERKNRTDQLLLTAPVSVPGIVFGKFIALALFHCIICAVMAVTPLVLSRYGDVSMPMNYLGLFGFFLYGLTCLSIGLFISSLTENVVISGIVTFVVLLLGILLPSIGQNLGLSGAAGVLFNAYDFTTPLKDFYNGILSWRYVVYFASITFLVLFLTCQAVYKRRYTVSVKRFAASAFSTGAIAIAIAGVLAANIVMTTVVPDTVTDVDLTTKKYYSLTSDTEKFLKSYDTPVTIYVIGKKADVNETVQKTIANIHQKKNNIKISYVDTVKEPTFVSTYTDQDLATNSLILVREDAEGRNRVISSDSLFSYTYDSSYQPVVSGYDGEGQIVSGLTYIASDDLPKVYQLTGHDETAMSGGFSDAMEKANYEVDSLNLLSADEVPADCQMLIINAPQSDFSADDVTKLKTYYDNGGKLLVALDFASFSSEPNLKGFLTAYGITAHTGVVAETADNYYYNSQFFLLPNVETTDFTSGINGTLSVFAPYTVALTHGEDGDITFTDILTTSDKAISKAAYADREKMTDQTVLTGAVTAEEGDETGKFDAGLLASNKEEGELFVFGSTYIFSDSADSYVSGRNGTLFSQLMSYAIPSESDIEGVVIPTKEYNATYLTVSNGLIRFYGLFFSVFLPLVLIVAGIVVWAVRRRK